MRFTFHAPDARGLRLIEEIPDLSFCHLEGRNGIGKTLSVRLLELVSGDQPYRGAPHAWETLRDQLGDSKVTVDGLPEGRVEIHLEPSQWPSQPLPGLTEELGHVTLRGEAISWQDLRRMLSVVRIAGDETLTDTLARELEQRAVEARLLAQGVQDDVAAWDETLSAMAELTARLEPERLKALHQDSVAAVSKSRDTAATVRAAGAKVRTRERVWRMLVSAGRRLRSFPDMLAGLEDASAKLEDADSRVESLNADLQRMARAAAIGQQARAELDRWERLRGFRERALSRAILAERETLRLLGLEQRPNVPTMKDLIAEARRALADTREQLRELDVTGNLRALTDDLNQVLVDAPTALDDHVVAATTPPVSTAALRDGVRARHDELEGVPRPGEVEALVATEADATRRLARLNQLQTLIGATGRKQGNLDEAVANISRLMGAAKDAQVSAELMERIRSEQEARVSAALDALVWVQRLAEVLGTTPVDPRSILGDDLVAAAEPSGNDEAQETEEPWADLLAPVDGEQRPAPPASPTDVGAWRQLARDLDAQAAEELAVVFPEAAAAILSEGTPDEAIAAATQRAATDLEEQRVEFAAALVAARQARDEATRTGASRNEAIGRLEAARRDLEDPDGPWSGFLPGLDALRAAIHEPPSGAIDSTLLVAAAFLTKVSCFATDLAETARRVRDGLDAVSLILLVEARRLSPRVAAAAGDRVSALSIDVPSTHRVREWAEGELATLIGVETLLEELFDQADAVTVDLEKARISWRTKSDSRPRLRPLEAFSSGEQVFAYTRARLDLLRADPRQAEHRVVVLDEFGAFVARDRFGQLLEFVRDQALGVLAEQVIVMLPLARDYTTQGVARELEQVDAPIGGLGELERISQVSRREYFAVPADPVGV